MTTLETVPTITLPADEARERWREYRAAIKAGTEAPGDREAAACFHQLAQGRVVLDLNAAMAHAGLQPDTGLPALAVAPAHVERVAFTWRWRNGTASAPVFSPARDSWGSWDFDARRAGVFRFEPDAIPNDWSHDVRRPWVAMLPSIPPRIRPRGQLERYHVLWEPVWEPSTAPIDPFLLRRLGSRTSRLFVVLAAWDLTDVERAVLEGIRGGAS